MTVRGNGLRWLLVLAVLPALGFDWQGRVARLERELAHGDTATRREAVRRLGGLDGSEVGPTLVSALDDPDPSVRLEAADACAHAGVRDAGPHLVEWLDDTDTETRATAVRALGRLAEARATPALVRALADAQPVVRRAAVHALESIGGPDVVVPLLGRLDDVETDVRVAAAEALARLGDVRALVPLVGKARDGAPEVRAAALGALGALGDARATPALLQGLRDDVPEVKLAAITALGRLAPPDAVAQLAAIAHGVEPRAARAAVAALGGIDSPDAVDEVLRASTDPDTQTIAREVLVSRAREGNVALARAAVARIAAALDAAGPIEASAYASLLVELCAWVPIDTAAPALLRALASDRGDRATLLRALGETGSPEVLVPLLEQLGTPDQNGHLVALAALGAYFDRTAPDGRAADPLLAALGRASLVERPRVVALLGRVRAARAVPSLRALLASHDPELRIAAVRALGAIGDPSAAGDLRALLGDRDAQLRYETARALGAIVTAHDVSELLALLGGTAPADRHALLVTLATALPRLRSAGSLDDASAASTVATLGTLLQSDDELLAARAATTLAAWADARGEPALAAAASRDPERRPWLVRALGALDGDAAHAAVRAALHAGDPEVVLAAAGALGEHGDATDAVALTALARSAPWPAPAAATFSLARIALAGHLSATPALTTALCDAARSRDPNARANVAVALTALGVPRCPDASPIDWLSSSPSPALRAAAARWVRAGAGSDATDPARRALAHCVETDPSPDVVVACRDAAPAPRDASVDAYAYAPGATVRLARALVALRLADGTVLVSRTDPLAHLWLAHAPRGRVAFDDPTSVPFERR